MTTFDPARARALLLAGAAPLGISLSGPQADRLLRYLALLAHWSRAIRLTGLRDPYDWVETHLLDSLTLLRALPTGGGRLLDVGSGAGLPGIPVAVVAPEWSVSLLERHSRKCAFLRAAVADLGLDNAEVLEGDATRSPVPAYDVAVSRAAWALGEWLPIAVRWLAPVGCVVAMLGRDVPVPAALAAVGAAAGLTLAWQEHFRLPASGAERTLTRWHRAPPSAQA